MILCLYRNNLIKILKRKLVLSISCYHADASVGNKGFLVRKLQSKGLLHDPVQIKVTEALENIHNDLEKYRPTVIGRTGFFSKLFTKPKVNSAPKGLYIYGSVGGGKTTLMDLFYDSCTSVEMKTRVHFNSFMNNVHSKIHEVKQKTAQTTERTSTKLKPFDATEPVARIIASQSYLICFDEFQVTDIADAMILKQLFYHLFEFGVVMVATSNRAPDDLYKNGLQRSNFLPVIGLLKKRCVSISLDNGIDYRRLAQKDGSTNYFVKLGAEEGQQIDKIFKYLCSQENDIIRPRTITHFGRDLTFSKTCGQVLDSTFSELCDRPLAASDYLQIAQYFHTVIIRDIPQLNLLLKSQTRRFINMIDTLYDNRVRVIVSADVPLDNLFSKEKFSEISDSDRVLMDDLKIEHGTTESTSSVFTGDEEVFAIDRTISRLTEMQSKDYWDQWEKHK